MVLKIALGVVLAAAFLRFVRRHRHCGGRGFGMHHGFGGFRGFRGRGIMFMLRDLGLTAEQVDKLRPAFLSGKGALSLLKFSHAQALHGLVSAVAAEPLDRARLDGVASRHADDQAQASRDLVAAVAQAYEVLTPEQREKIRARIARFGFAGPGRPWSGGEGPYRTMI